MAKELLVLQETDQSDTARALAADLSEQGANSEAERIELPHGYRYVDSKILSHPKVDALFRKVEIGKDLEDNLLLERNIMAAAEGFTPVDVAVENDKGELVGFGSLFCRGEEGELGDFVVSPEYQSQGIGKTIILERMRLAKEKGITTLRIPGIEETNMLHLSKGKPSFYRELGFRSNEQEGGLIWQAEQESTVLRSDDPVVSMDLALGKAYKDVQFDYDAFRGEVERLGMDPQDVAGMPIRIKQPKLTDLRGGFYDIDGDKSITVNAGHKVNKRLSHELQHRADDVHDMPMKDAKYKTGRLSAITADKLAGLGVIGAVAAAGGSEMAEHIVTSPYYLMALGGTALASAGYFLHPAEIKARKAANTSPHQIVTTVIKE